MPNYRALAGWLPKAVFFLAAIVVPSALSFGDPVTITGYDIQNASPSGCGNWEHTYTGTITPTGDIGPQNCDLANYTGGSGTLNDGVIGDSTQDTQLFFTSTDSTITLYLSATVTLTDLEIFGGDIADNPIPGVLGGATFTFGGSSATLASTNVGPGSSASGPANNVFTFAGSALDGVFGDTLVISDVTGAFNNNRSYSITEIQLSGDEASAVPEPGSLLLFGSGLLSIARLSIARLSIARLSIARLSIARSVRRKTCTAARR